MMQYVALFLFILGCGLMMGPLFPEDVVPVVSVNDHLYTCNRTNETTWTCHP